MKIIEKLSEKIEEEIEDSECYSRMALEYKEEYPDVARVLHTISGEEMNHMTMLHECVVKLIDGYRKEKGEPPADMMAVYNYLHKQQIDKAKEAKVLQEMYK